MIIDVTDFTNRPTKVPNQEESRDFSSFIGNAEKELAVKYLLGYSVWTEFLAATEGSGTLQEPWASLKNGADYTHYGKTYRYEGWVDMIKPAIWSMWVPRGSYKFTNVGHVENMPTDKSTLIDNEQFIVEQWNSFASKVGICYNRINSFYGFMKANESDFDDWCLNLPGTRNRFI